ncbi:MAG: alanine racemase, partial [Armatimonadetes bacterium]|nr:alanine racemase [Armatimonadota bacterium]
MRPAWIEVDLSAIRQNTRVFAELCAPGCGVCAVVKGNAYGHGAVEVARAALEAGAQWLSVAMVQEAAELRAAGIEAPILILGESAADEAEAIIEAGAAAEVSTVEVAKALGDAGRRMGKAAEVHLKIDSGMGRQGARLEDLPALLEALRELPAVRVSGIFTHFAVAESDEEFTRWQYQNFMRGVAMAEAVLGNIPVKHCCNTAAAVLYPEMHHDLIRPGAGIYGLNPGVTAERFPAVRRALSLRA